MVNVPTPKMDDFALMLLSLTYSKIFSTANMTFPFVYDFDSGNVNFQLFGSE